MINDLVISQIRQRLEILYQMVDELETSGGGGGGGGTTDYNELTHKPSINNVTLSGNRSLDDIGVSQAISDALTPVQTAISGKVDKVAGKGLSTNDFTNTDKVNLSTALSKANAAAPQSTTYTKAQVDTKLAAKLNTADVDDALSGTSTNPVQNKVIQAPVAKLVNDGAKNLLKNTATSRTFSGVTFTVNNDDSVTVTGTATGSTGFRIAGAQGSNAYADAIPIPRGRYTIYPSNSGSSTIRWGIGIMTASNATRNVTYIFDSPVTIDVTNDTTRYDFTLAVSNGTVCNGETLYPMICTAEDYEISSEYVPYAENNYELTRNKVTKEEATDISFGLGTLIPNNTDWNTLIDIGNYYVASSSNMATMTNAPTTGAGGRLEVKNANAATTKIQMFYTASATNPRFYIRMYLLSGGTLIWTPWYQFTVTALT